MWRQRRWRLLLNVIRGLPRNSAYGEALAMDESLVDREQLHIKRSEQPRPSVRDWSPEVELLAAIFDRLSDVVQVQSSKDLRRQLKPWPSPLTAAEVLRQYERARKRSYLEQLVEQARQRAREQMN